MGYLQEADGWLEEALESFIDALEQAETDEQANEIFDATKRALKEKILESYHNGKESSGGAVKKGVKRFTKRFSRQRQSAKPRG